MALAPGNFGSLLANNITAGSIPNQSQLSGYGINSLQNQYAQQYASQVGLQQQLMGVYNDQQFSALERYVRQQKEHEMKEQLTKAFYDPNTLDIRIKGLPSESLTNRAWLDQRISEVSFRL